MNAVPLQSAIELSQAFEAHTLSPVEVVDAMLIRIEALDPKLHSFLEICADRARLQAKLSEQRMMAGLRLGPLDGVPVAHKDNLNVAGVPTAANSGLYRGRKPARDASVVGALARAGMIFLGKTGCYEAAFAGPDHDLPWPVPCNPWNVERSTAGSSSGSAVAIAAGLATVATGSDTGGSLRDPAALCGVTGYKPKFGSLPTGGMFPFAPSLDTVGPMARTPAEVALVTAAMRGNLSAANLPTAPARGLRIGLVPRWSEELGATDGVMEVFSTAVDALRAHGAELVNVELPSLSEYAAAGWTIAMAELRESHADTLEQQLDGMGPLLSRGLAVADLIPAYRYIAALRYARTLARITEAACEDLDVILTPGQDTVAQPISQLEGMLPFEKPSITIPFCVTGAAALVMPAGLSEGLPVGVQLASMRSEAHLFRAACALDRALDQSRLMPPEVA